VWPFATKTSTSAGPKNFVPPKTRIRFGAKLAHTVDESKDEHVEAAVTNAEFLRNALRSITLYPWLK